MPTLTIIGGPNGAGKSISSEFILTSQNILAFDFDKEFYSKWRRFDYDPAVEQGVRTSVQEQFEEYLKMSFKNKTDVAFETNFHDIDILDHVREAKTHDFEVNLVFIGLKNHKLAISRVRFREAQGGHSVNTDTIIERFNKGLALLESSYHLFDMVLIFESLQGFKAMRCILIESGKVRVYARPSFVNHIPQIASLV